MSAAGRLYAVEFHNVSIAAQQDFFYLKPAADKICKLHAVYLSNVGGNLDAGDAQEELFRLEVIYLPATVTVGSGGNAFTPTPMLTSDAAAGATTRINDTTVATTSGTAVNKHSDGINVRIPYTYLPLDEHRISVANAAALVVRLVSTPADAVLFNGTMLFEELP
jgi:hypothetical protein